VVDSGNDFTGLAAIGIDGRPQLLRQNGRGHVPARLQNGLDDLPLKRRQFRRDNLVEILKMLGNGTGGIVIGIIRQNRMIGREGVGRFPSFSEQIHRLTISDPVEPGVTSLRWIQSRGVVPENECSLREYVIQLRFIESSPEASTERSPYAWPPQFHELAKSVLLACL